MSSQFRYSYITNLSDLQKQLDQAKSMFRIMEKSLSGGLPVGGVDPKIINAQAKYMSAEARNINAKQRVLNALNTEQMRYNRYVNEGTSAANRFTKSNENSVTTLKTFASVVGTVGVIKFGNDLFQSAVKMDTMVRSLTAIEGSANKGKKALSDYIEMAKSPGLTLLQAQQGVTQLKMVEVNADLAKKAIMEIGNAVALVGGGGEVLGRVVTQFVQMQGKGKVMQEDLRVIAESLPMIRRYMKEAFGTTDTAALEKRGVTPLKFLTKIVDIMSKEPRATGGLQNAIDNIHDSIMRLEAALMGPLVPGIQKVADELSILMDQFQKLPTPIQTLIGEGVVVGTGVLGLSFALSGLITIAPAVIGAVKNLSTAFVGMNTAVGASSIAGSAGLFSMLKGVGPLAAVLVAYASLQDATKKTIEAATKQIDYTQLDKNAKAVLVGRLENVRKALTQQITKETYKPDEGLNDKSLIAAETLFPGIPGKTSAETLFGFINKEIDKLNGNLEKTKVVSSKSSAAVAKDWDQIQKEFQKLTDITGPGFNWGDKEKLSWFSKLLEVPQSLTPEARTGIWRSFCPC